MDGEEEKEEEESGVSEAQPSTSSETAAPSDSNGAEGSTDSPAGTESPGVTDNSAGTGSDSASTSSAGGSDSNSGGAEAGTSGSTPEATGGNVVSDDNLRMRLNMTVFEADDPMQDITAAMLASLSSLNLSGAYDVSDWSWLKYCTSLEDLDLGNSSFSDLTLITSSALKRLTLGATAPKNLSELARFTALEYLNLNEISAPEDGDEDADHEEEEVHDHEHSHGGKLDASVLEGLTNLKELHILEAEVLNAEKLQSLSALEVVDADESEGVSFASFAKALHLRSLHLKGVGASDVEALAALTSLEELGAEDNAISSLAPFAGLSKLRVLNLKNNPFTDISALASLTSLESLNLSKTSVTPDEERISDISALSGLTNLSDLNIDYNKVESLAPLSGLSNLRTLRANHTGISSVDGLENLNNLVSVSVTDNSALGSLSALASLTGLQEVQASRSAVASLTGLESVFNGENIFIFNVSDQTLTHELTAPAGVDSAFELVLPKGVNSSYVLSDVLVAAGASVVERGGDPVLVASSTAALYAAADGDLSVTFSSDFGSSGKSYSGVVKLVKAAAVDVDEEGGSASGAAGEEAADTSANGHTHNHGQDGGKQGHKHGHGADRHSHKQGALPKTADSTDMAGYPLLGIMAAVFAGVGAALLRVVRRKENN